MFRQAILNLKIKSTWGLSRQSSSSSPTYYLHSSPGFIIEQTLPDLSKRFVLLFDDQNQMHPIEGAEMVWRTSDGNPPQSELIVEIIRQSVVQPAIVAVKFIAAHIFIAICLTIFLLVKWRNCQGVEDSFKRMTFGTFIGSLFGLIAVFAYPHSDGNKGPFCKLAPALVAFSLILVTTCLAIKILLKFVCQHQKNSIKINTKLKTKSTILVLIVLVVIFAIVLAHETGDISFHPEKFHHSFGQSEDIMERMTIYENETCTSSDFRLGWVVLGFVLAIALFGILSSIAVRKSPSTFGLYMSDLELSSRLLYLISTIVLVLFMALLMVANNEIIQFTILVIFSFVQSLALIGGFWWWKLGSHFDKQPNSPNKMPIFQIDFMSRK